MSGILPPRTGIPTTYKGVRMRSRLEARWAVMFDLLEWGWEYEPIDLRFYVPDYLIEGKLLFEVKGNEEDFAAAESKIIASGWTAEAIIAGSSIDGSIIGRFLEWQGDEPQWGAAEIFFCISCGRPSLKCAEGSWRCRLCGETEGHVGDWDPRDAWVASANRVQWRPE